MSPPVKKQGYYHFPDRPEFRPNLSPLEIIKQGAFGGTYFRPITSQVTQKNYQNRHTRYFSKSLLNKHQIDPQKYLTRPWSEYDKSHNKFGVKCGQTLAQWEGKNWISHHDPYGWFEWYCNFFFKNRRVPEEDDRQIKRWLNFAGPQGRFSQRLRNMCVQQKKKLSDPSVSPVIRQSLHHWGMEIK